MYDIPRFWDPDDPQSAEDVLHHINEDCWRSWRNAYRPWWRQVEENVRMLAGRQWDTYIEGLADFVDLSSYFAIDDERWRKYPVFNWLGHYYKITRSKLTENPPAIGYLPHSPDERDARLAQTGEPVWKAAWLAMDMPELVFDLYGWLLTAGRGILMTTWNPDKGIARDYTGPAIIHLLGPGGLETRELSDAPYLRLPDGSFYPAIENPLAAEDGGQYMIHPESGEPIFAFDETAEGGIRMGAPFNDRVGEIEASIINPTSIVTPFGPEPFWRKPWYTREYAIDVDDIERRFGQVLQPEYISSGDVLHLKLEFGANYGMPGQGLGGHGSLAHINKQALDHHVLARETWYRERPNHEFLSRGRLSIVTKQVVLYDDINPYWVEGNRHETVMPFEAFDLCRYPFRQEGTSDLETLNPIQRAINRRMGGAMDAVDFNEQPITLKDRNAGIEEDNADLRRPGNVVEFDGRVGSGEPIRIVPAGDLPKGSIDLAQNLQNWMQLLGSLPIGSEGLPVTTDASGELQREVRFDTDRAWGGTLRQHSYAWARVAMKVIGIYGACVDDERILTLSGEDNAWDFLTVGPDLFKGTVHAYPQPESMVLETRQEKQNRILTLAKAFPNIPQEIFVDLLGYPDLARLTRPGGPAWAMAERENLEMRLGQLPPVLPEHDHAVHLMNHKRRMQTIEYRDLPPEIQQLFTLHVHIHELLAQQEAMRQIGLTAPVQAAASAAAAAANPQLAGGPGAGAPGGGSSGPSEARIAAHTEPPPKAPGRADLAAGRVSPGEADPRRLAILHA